MANLTPKQAAQAALASYDIQNEVNDPNKPGTSVARAFADLSDQFDFSPASRFRGVSGGAFLMKETGFGVIAKGKGIFQHDALVVIRGTASGWDGITDIHAGRVSPHNGIVVHSGFSKAFNSLDIENQFLRLFQGRNPQRVHCVGHSLGGAVATLVADWAARKSMNAKLYSFGCPRVGHERFAKDITMRIKPHNIFRVYHGSDVVPMIPVWPFIHAPSHGTSCYIDYSTMNPIKAHSMKNYLEHVRDVGTFSRLRQKPPMVNWEAESKAWLRRADSHGILLNSQTYAMISHVLAYLMKKILTVTAMGLQETAGNVSDYLDRLAIYLQKGAQASKEIEQDVKGLMEKMLGAVGIFPGSSQSLTADFIRWVFTLFTNAMYRLVKIALRPEAQIA